MNGNDFIGSSRCKSIGVSFKGITATPEGFDTKRRHSPGNFRRVFVMQERVTLRFLQDFDIDALKAT